MKYLFIWRQYVLNRYVTMANYSFCFMTCASLCCPQWEWSAFLRNMCTDKEECSPRQGANKSPPDTSSTSLAGLVWRRSEHTWSGVVFLSSQGVRHLAFFTPHLELHMHSTNWTSKQRWESSELHIQGILMELSSAVFRMTKCHTCGSGSTCKGYICIHEFFLLGGGPITNLLPPPLTWFVHYWLFNTFIRVELCFQGHFIWSC